MAGNEIYRVEIPIIVDDQTEAPLRQAEERVSRFQRTAEKQAKMVREHLLSLSKLQIEPVMRIKDQLTNSVLNADKLIKKLGMEQASPLIEAQDRVSAVATRIDATLKALDKGNVKVLAELQGPLMDEIVKAKASLSVLNNVKAGPVAELRGELFGQLAQAMSQVKGLDSIIAQPQATLWDQVTWKAREIGGALRQLTSRAWSVVVDVKDRVTSTVKGIVSKVGRLLSHPLTLLGVGGGITAATGYGLKAVMEEQDLVSSFEVMLGDRKAAENRMQELIAFAGQTPFTRQEIWRSSRQLELLTGGALATGEGLRMVGDIAAGTVQPFEEVAMWVGRLHDGLQSGRPIGQAAMRLQEMGALSGESRAKLEKLAESGKNISKTWPLAAQEFERFAGLMEKQSKNLKNIVLGTKTFFTENVIKRWGQGIADVLQPALMKFRAWRGENTETIKRMGDAIEQFGRRVGGTLVGYFERVIERISAIMSDPRFKHASFAEKVQMLVGAAMDDVVAWLKGPGKDKMVEAFKTIGEAAAKAYVGAMKTLGKTAIDELKQGNIMAAAAPAAAMWYMGGGALAKGVWGLGKGAWGLGKTMAGSQLVASGASVLGKVLPALGTTAGITVAGGTLGVAGIGAGAYDIYRGIKERDPEEASKRYWAGGTKLGMVGAGAAIGSVVPGVGTAVGAGVGGIAALFTGTAAGEALRNFWDSFAAWASEAWDEIKGAAERAWDWITENVTWESLAKGIGFVLGYLEGTIFNADWWLGKWDAVRGWAEEKWEAFAEIWENVKGTILDTIFSGDWWLGKWGDVKGWTEEKWEKMESVWENAKKTIKSTLFSKEWWSDQWGAVRKWADDALSGIAKRWDIIKESFAGGRAAGRQAAEAKQYATGGILTRPHLGLVAEAGPEAIIPLTKPARAWELWQNVGERMGFFSREKVDYAIPTKIAQQRLTLSASGMGADRPTSVLTRGMSEPLEKLETETRRITTRGYEAINRIKSVVEWVKRVAHTADFYTTAGDFSGTSAGPAGYMPLVTAAAAKFNIPAGLLSRLIQAESSWRPGVVSHAGAIGLTQVMPDTARGMGYSVEALRRSPEIQIEAGAKYLAQQYNRFGSWPLALAAYNAGPGAVSKHGGIPPYRETQNYVAKILSPKAYARGGILTRPHIGMVAENGPEAIIPLSTGMRPRALKLWAETGKMLGAEARGRTNVISLSEHRNIKAYASGGFTGAVLSLPVAAGGWDVPISDPKQAVPRVANINLNFDLAGLVGQVVIENKDDIDGAVDKITGAIANNLRSVFQNMTK
jgi:SLT domain-containing protein